MKEQNTGEYDALVDEVEKLRAEIARLRAEREELRSVAKEMAEQVALLPAADGRILGLLPVLCRLRFALA